MPRFDEDCPLPPHDPARSPRWRRAIALLVLGLACAAVLWHHYRSGVPAAVTDPGDAEIACVSYAPFRLPGETPFDPTARVSPERIVDDLRHLSSRTRCVRTYSVAQGLDAVPDAARELGMRVLLGAWISRDADENEAELARAIEIANSHTDVVDGLIVGNEVLLRRELPPEALSAHIERAQRETEVPVTYADVWEFWSRNQALAAHVDFVTVHILPYWEDEPIEVGAAVDHVISIANRMRETFEPPILIGETGWPSKGRQREGAVPSLVNQAEFVRRFVSAASDAKLDYNLIEAFDQPWKRRLEGAMGGYWGVLDAAAEPKFPWRGPVVENASAGRGLVAAALGAVLGLLVALATRLGAAGTLGAVLLLAPTATMLVRHWDDMLAWNRSPIEWAGSGGWAVIGAVVCLLAAPRIGQRLDGRALAPMPAAARVTLPGAHDRLLVAGRLLVLAGACVMAVLLLVDARYRGFPIPLYLMPAVALAMLGWLGDRPPSAAAEERVLALLLAGAIAIVAFSEGASNAQSVGFAAVSLAIAAACWPRRAAARAADGGPADAAGPDQRRASTSTATTSATAAGSNE